MPGVRVGVVVIAHGDTASHLLEAAREIVGNVELRDVLAVDAGAGETPQLAGGLCDAMDAVDEGAGVLLLVDLAGASPCNCAQRQATGHELATLSGVNLAMLLKLGSMDRGGMDIQTLARAVAESGRRAVAVVTHQDRADHE